MRNIPIRLLFVALLFVGGTLIAKLLQCPKCGYEYQEGQATCQHCGTALPAKQAAAPVAAPAAPPITADIMSHEFADVEKARDAKQSGLLIFRARNTLALLKLAPEASNAGSGDLLTAIKEAETALRDAKIPCFACRGTGQRIYSLTDMHGDVRRQESAPGTVTCPVCDGAGKLPARTSQTVIVAAMSNAKQEFERQQQARGWENFAGIWLPKGLSDHLTIRQKAAVKGTLAGTCSTCYGFGFFGCVDCKGAGKLKCTNVKCIQGKEPCPVCKGKKKITDTTGGRGNSVAHTCNACSGTGISLCAICGGRAYLVCAKCESTGQIRCTTCKGTGENALCTKCDGSGLVPCAACKGTGEIRGAPCPTCHGEKEAVCTICNGTGHKVRSY